jgi:hypothetical protein
VVLFGNRQIGSVVFTMSHPLFWWSTRPDSEYLWRAPAVSGTHFPSLSLSLFFSSLAPFFSPAQITWLHRSFLRSVAIGCLRKLVEAPIHPAYSNAPHWSRCSKKLRCMPNFCVAPVPR